MYYAPHSLRFEVQTSEDTTLVDIDTARYVELLTSSWDPRSKDCLFGYLNHCSTPGGVKLLRANLFQPPARLELIQRRLDAVHELVESLGMFHSLQAGTFLLSIQSYALNTRATILCTVVSRFCDTEHVLAVCVTVPRGKSPYAYEEHLNGVIGLKRMLELVELLRDSLAGADSPLLADMLVVLSDSTFDQLLSEVSTVIEDTARIQKGTATMRLQRCFAVKQGASGMVDLARQAYCVS